MPEWKDEVRKRLNGSKLAPAQENDIVEELAQHLEQVYESSLQGGATEAEAEQTALLELAGDNLRQDIQRSKKPFPQNPIVESSGRSNLLTGFRHDLRFAMRMLLKNPGFTIVTVTALALGIGANTAIFSVVNAVLLRPLPYKEPERLVMVWEDASKSGHPRDTLSAANFIDWRNQNQVFESMAAITDESFNLTGSGDPERLEGLRVSASLFPLLGVEPQLGRVFTAAEDQPGSKVVLLSYGLWQRRFGGDPSIAG